MIALMVYNNTTSVFLHCSIFLHGMVDLYHYTCLIITSLAPILECKLHQGKDFAVFTSVCQTKIPPEIVGTHSIFV